MQKAESSKTLIAIHMIRAPLNTMFGDLLEVVVVGYCLFPVILCVVRFSVGSIFGSENTVVGGWIGPGKNGDRVGRSGIVETKVILLPIVVIIKIVY